MSSRQVFLVAMKQARCPRCRGRVLETQMPDVVCEKCSTRYTLATRAGGFFGGVTSQLIEKEAAAVYVPTPQPQIQQVAASGRFCFNCGSPVQEAARFCTGCGKQLS